jgi:hypothetical protein
VPFSIQIRLKGSIGYIRVAVYLHIVHRTRLLTVVPYTLYIYNAYVVSVCVSQNKQLLCQFHFPVHTLKIVYVWPVIQHSVFETRLLKCTLHTVTVLLMLYTSFLSEEVLLSFTGTRRYVVCIQPNVVTESNSIWCIHTVPSFVKLEWFQS